MGKRRSFSDTYKAEVVARDSHGCDQRLHRELLQPAPEAFVAGLRQPVDVRTAARHGGASCIITVSTESGQAHGGGQF